MNNISKHYITTLLYVGASLIGSSAAMADQYRIGTLHIACQVTTVKGRDGYVSVRAENMEEAKIRATGARGVITPALTREAVDSLKECVELPTGEFSDRDFQTWVDEQMPR